MDIDELDLAARQLPAPLTLSSTFVCPLRGHPTEPQEVLARAGVPMLLHKGWDLFSEVSILVCKFEQKSSKNPYKSYWGKHGGPGAEAGTGDVRQALVGVPAPT